MNAIICIVTVPVLNLQLLLHFSLCLYLHVCNVSSDSHLITSELAIKTREFYIVRKLLAVQFGILDKFIT